MLALLDSLLTTGFDTTDQARRALAWYDNRAYTPDDDGRFDIGNARDEQAPNFRRSGDEESLTKWIPGIDSIRPKAA